MKVEVQKYERLSDVYREMLSKLSRFGPVSNDPEDIRAFRRVRRSLRERLRRCEQATGHNQSCITALAPPLLNGLPPGDNPSDNGSTSGEENA
jgi:hypothetical protein